MSGLIVNNDSGEFNCSRPTEQTVTPTKGYTPYKKIDGYVRCKKKNKK